MYKAKASNYKCSAVAKMGDHLTTTDMGQKLWGGGAPLGELGPMYHNVAWAKAYLRTK